MSENKVIISQNIDSTKTIIINGAIINKVTSIAIDVTNPTTCKLEFVIGELILDTLK